MLNEPMTAAPKPKHVIKFRTATPEQIEESKAGRLKLWRYEDGEGNVLGYCTREEIWA